ncbi:phage scaffolding protein [Paenibacillus sp. GbtcB18]|uniref:phage scaffolding protein n=1 Tax=Paenibacillus sp. GbtcB18 TaxID=2824763 RepID=UPI001C3095B1|nr:phage scaffolding protein [Paenibacillus sp. GbtcB18]
MDLKELLGEELYNNVMEKAGDKHKLAIVSDGNWIPKEKFNEANTAKKQAEDTLKERDKQLEELKKSTKDNAELQGQIQKLQDENKAATEQYNADLKELQLNSALKLALSGQAHDIDIVAGLLDKSKIELDEAGGIKGGLDDQVKALRESKGFLFAEKQADKGPAIKGARPAEGSRTPNAETVNTEIANIFSQR